MDRLSAAAERVLGPVAEGEGLADLARALPALAEAAALQRRVHALALSAPRGETEDTPKHTQATLPRTLPP